MIEDDLRGIEIDDEAILMRSHEEEEEPIKKVESEEEIVPIRKCICGFGAIMEADSEDSDDKETSKKIYNHMTNLEI